MIQGRNRCKVSLPQQHNRMISATRGDNNPLNNALVQPHKTRSRGDISVPCQKREVLPPLRPLQHNRARAPRDPARDQELLLRPPKLHPADLVKAREDVPEELELRLHAEDRDRVPARVLHARVAVRHVDERLPERRRRLSHEDLRRGHRSACGEAWGRDVEVRDEGPGGAVRCGRDLLLRQGARELVDRIERVSCGGNQVKNGQGTV